jgi:hypothetical protein
MPMSAWPKTVSGAIEPTASKLVGPRSPPTHALSRLWAHLRARPWSWIAVVPADPDLSAVPLARAMRDAGNWLSQQPVQLRIVQNVDLGSTASLVHHLGESSRFAGSSKLVPHGVQTVVATDSPLRNALVLPVIIGAEGVVLCVSRGATSVANVRATIEMIGREQIVATVLLD